VVPFGAPVILLVEPEHRAEAVRLARRIGYDNLSFLDGGLDAWRAAGLPVDSVEEIDATNAENRQRAGTMLLDVRQRSELDAVRIPGAVHVELGDIIAGTSPPADDVIILCGHGERSATAASLLERRGLRVANLVGGTSAWMEADLPVEV
jgi:rhodanese-related sulfurtransferase